MQAILARRSGTTRWPLFTLVTSVNLTARKAGLHLPAAHYLESWGDARAADGTYSIVQPMIQPLYDGVSEIEVLLALQGQKALGPSGPPWRTCEEAPKTDAAYDAVRDDFWCLSGWHERRGVERQPARWFRQRFSRTGDASCR
jgi:anaerobic selenocysteine-containing dehydrogenase